MTNFCFLSYLLTIAMELSLCFYFFHLAAYEISVLIGYQECSESSDELANLLSLVRAAHTCNTEK